MRVLVIVAALAAPARADTAMAFGASGGLANTALRSTDGGTTSNGAFVEGEADYHASPRWSIAALVAYSHVSGTVDDNGYHIPIEGGASNLLFGVEGRLWISPRFYVGGGVGAMDTRSDHPMSGERSSQSSPFIQAELGITAVRLEPVSIRVSGGVDLFVFDSVSRTAYAAVGIIYR